MSTLTTAKRAKRDKILAAAVQVFAHEGFHNTDVQVIADLAKVGKGTVYRHFGNKQDLFLATSRYCIEKASGYIDKRIGGPGQMLRLAEEHGIGEVLRRIGRGCGLFYRRHPHFVEMLVQERAEFRNSIPTHLMFRAETRGDFDKMFRTAVRDKQIRKVKPLHATNAYRDMLFGSIVNGCLEGGSSRLVERIDNAVDLFIIGLEPRE